MTIVPPTADGPQVSIVIVTCARPVDLRRCLRELSQHLAAADAPATEVLAVHAPGDDDVMAMVRAEFPWVAVHACGRRNISVQRNLGARRARGEIIVYLDDDAWPRPGWLAALAGAFVDPRTVGAGGPVFRGDGSLQCGPMLVSPLGRLVCADRSSTRRGMSPTLPGCNMAFRRRDLFACGGFDENLAYHHDDADLCRRLFARSAQEPGALAHAAAAQIWHESSPGPYRRTLQDRAWFVVAMNSVYFAFCHAHPLRALVCAGPLQLPKVVRMFAWVATGKLGPIAFLRCLGKQVAGTIAGYVKGLCRRPALPLQPLRDSTAAAAARDAAPRAVESVACQPAGHS
jgi:GT2 family glycosyltransferase